MSLKMESMVEALYARVIQRVCQSYREASHECSKADINELQKKWQEKLQLYTGKISSATIEENATNSSAIHLPNASSASITQTLDGDSKLSVPLSSSSSCSSDESESLSAQMAGRPSAQLPNAAPSTTSSIFSKMLGSKRKLQQFDGFASDDEDTIEWKDASIQTHKNIDDAESSHEFSRREVRMDRENQNDSDTESECLLDEDEEIEEEDKKGSYNPMTSVASQLVSSEDFAPVSGLSGINLPLQIAAEYSKFDHHGKRRGYHGKLHAIVLTWPRYIRATEVIHPGDMVWCCPDSMCGFSREGELVKVTAVRKTRRELVVSLRNGTETTVLIDRVRRLNEYLIRKGVVRLRSLYNG
ncbi:hypothetical protein CCR75_003360 [Bremia lactucae]|uniref:Uncharacterized protein n=1 Tax=Bremia lactucae TaxID=4779 RepID=A0A976FIE1_BRELC|nr:hypothetical protein CCR75_003360 [Bremia lactucae]